MWHVADIPRFSQVHAIGSLVVFCYGHQRLHGLLYAIQPELFSQIYMALLPDLLRTSRDPGLCVLVHPLASRPDIRRRRGKSSKSLPSRTDIVLTHGRLSSLDDSSGVGSLQSGMCSESTPTISPSGCAASYPPSSTLLWAIMCSTRVISCATCRSAIRGRRQRMTLRM